MTEDKINFPAFHDIYQRLALMPKSPGVDFLKALMDQGPERFSQTLKEWETNGIKLDFQQIHHLTAIASKYPPPKEDFKERFKPKKILADRRQFFATAGVFTAGYFAGQMVEMFEGGRFDREYEKRKAFYAKQREEELKHQRKLAGGDEAQAKDRAEKVMPPPIAIEELKKHRDAAEVRAKDGVITIIGMMGGTFVSGVFGMYGMQMLSEQAAKQEGGEIMRRRIDGALTDIGNLLNNAVYPYMEKNSGRATDR